MNLRGGYNAFEAARQAGVRKVIFTSTGQTVLNYGRGTWVSPDMPVRPITIYACTKVFGEALGRHYSDVHGLSVICIRLCWFQGYNSPLLRSMPEMHREWCSPRDLAQLVTRCLRTDVRFAIFFGISNNTGRYFDITNARELVGYDPQDDAVAQFGGKASGER
jgi:nucleoside-diphosphate-sugar epimerase